MDQPVPVADAETLFRDAERLHRSALERLAQGDLRDAAEKAWGATVAAGNGLLIARTGAMPDRSSATLRELRRLGGRDRAVQLLAARMLERESALHGLCFYLGICEPVDDTERLIRETADLITEARALARR